VHHKENKDVKGSELLYHIAEAEITLLNKLLASSFNH
jgi:hypothetical protein